MADELPKFADAGFVEFELLNWLKKEELTPHQIRLRSIDLVKIVTLALLGSVIGNLLHSGKIKVTKFAPDLSHPLKSDSDRYPFTVFLRAV